MNLLARLGAAAKALRTPPAQSRPPNVFGPAGPGFTTSSGWWRDDPAEQVRQFQSWVYAAVNAVGQEVARQRPQLTDATGTADHERTPLPMDHPLSRLLARPNPWLTPWELWYLTAVYLELTGNCFC